MASITDDTVVTRRTGVVEAHLADVHVVLNEVLAYSGLDDVGQRVWELVESPRTVAALVAALTAEFDVGAQECRDDVVAFVRSLQEHLLVDLRP